ncbi:MAG: transposase [Bacteroidales bacterium]|nr:transposase [Bacteroidales bacterium]
MMDKSWAPGFRDLVFKKIDERRYVELYSDIDSRPNFPVNVWVGLEVIKGMFDYTDAELLEQFHFNLLAAYALGLENLGEVTLSERTLYYNRKRLLECEAQTGRNLLEEEFQTMTENTLEKLGINTKTQRMDSSFVGSFIKQMSRLELIVKVLQNFYRDLDGKEQARWNPLVKEYVETEARHIAYYLKSAEVGDYLQRVGALLFELHQTYADNEQISALRSYEHIGRILLEQFNIVEGGKEIRVEVKPSREISARSLQNPADDTATCRTKDGRIYKGGLFNVAETCAPGNKVQLLTDVCVEQNVVADDDFLAERLPAIKERTGVEEMVTDANYTGEHSEKVCREETVAIIPTEVRGRKERVDRLSLRDFHFDGRSIVSCPEGCSPIEQIHKPESGRHVAHFAKAICGACPRANECPARSRKHFYSLAFSDRQALLAQRRQQLSQEDYRNKCRLRPAIEGTISQFKQKMRNGKLRIRGLSRIRNSIILMAIGINFGRVWAYLLETNPGITLFSVVVVMLALVLAIMVTRQTTYSDFKLCRTISR